MEGVSARRGWVKWKRKIRASGRALTEPGVGEGVFILLFILVWRAILGPSDLLLCRERRMEVKYALSPMPTPKGLPSMPTPKCRMGPLGEPNEKRESELRTSDYLQYLQFCQNLVVSVACSETGILFSSGLRV